MDDYIPKDDDIDSLADMDLVQPTIAPYPGPTDFGTWAESQFTGMIPNGTATFLDQFNLLSEKDVDYWTNLKAQDYLKMLGEQQYEHVRKTLAELRTIRKYVLEEKKKIRPNWLYGEYLTFREMYLQMNKYYFPAAKEIQRIRPDSLRDIRIIKPMDETIKIQPPPYTRNSPVVAKGNDPPMQPGSTHSAGPYQPTHPHMAYDNQFYNMNSPPQFWGASNSNWQRQKRMEPSQCGSQWSQRSQRSQRLQEGSQGSQADSQRSFASSQHSQGSSQRSRRTEGSPDESYHGTNSSRRFKSTPGPKRPGGPPDNLPSNSGHSIASIVPRSRQVAKAQSALSEKIQWDGQCSSFRPYKLAITGHLLQVGAAYLVDTAFHMSYMKYFKAGNDYLESEDFHVMYPDITIKQARIDRTYLYGMLISSNQQDGEQKFILKYESSQDGIAVWIKFLKDYDNNSSEEVKATKLENAISIKYSYRYPGGILKYIDTLQANLNELNILLPGQYLESHKRRILYKTSRAQEISNT